MRGSRRTALVLTVLLVVTPLSATLAPRAAGGEQHWIGVRVRGGEHQLFDRRTGDRFQPRGANLLMKVPEGDHVASGLFRPRDWDARAVERELAAMESLGYDTVRVFVDLCNVDCISTPGGSIRDAYAANVAAFLRIAKRHGIVVLLASVDVPDRGYSDRLPCCDPFGGYRNSLWLAPEGHDLLEEYWTELVQALIDHHAPLEVVLAYELQQEFFVLADVEPLSLDSGQVTTADGETYDLSDPAAHDAMVVSNVRRAVRRVGSAIRGLDRGSLITMGFFPQQPDDARLVYSEDLIERSALDLLDLHLYPGPTADLATPVEAIGLTDTVRKPVIMGEFGAFDFWFPFPRIGAYALARWQSASCAYGFDGWLVWLWARTDDEVFGARQGGDAIAELLSPDERPNPCRAGGVPRNVAPDGSATAAASLPGESPADAIDGDPDTQWSAGAEAPQHLEVDLGSDRKVREIHLLAAQFPDGETHHRLLLAGQDGVFEVVKVFEGPTADGDLLVFHPAEPVDARYIRVETVSSPSWVAWREIAVYA